MDSYVLVGSRDPELPDSRRCYELAGALADSGADVTVFLVQNGVLAARRTSAGARALSSFAGRTTVFADDFSLRQRAIPAAELTDGVTSSGIDGLVDAVMADGGKVLWF
jgi:predicted peroxiredoxin